MYKKRWLIYILLIPFTWITIAHSEDNISEVKDATEKLVHHYTKEIIPDITIPEKYKKVLPDNLHLKGFKKLTYDFGYDLDYDVTTNPFKPFDKIEFSTEFDNGSGSIIFDDKEQIFFQFKKTF
jgi:hypothetical protein